MPRAQTSGKCPPVFLKLAAKMACSGEPFVAFAASATNQPRSSPAGSGSHAPTKCQPSSQTSTQVWLPRLSAQLGVPASRAGTPTARQASASAIDSPVHDAVPCATDSFGLKLGGLRCGAYLSLSAGNSPAFSARAASDAVLHPATIGRQSS